MKTKWLLAAVAGAATACSSGGPTAQNTNRMSLRYSSSPSTVLVTNTTGGRLDVNGYPSFNPAVPQPLGGVLHLGSVAQGSSACLQIPDTIAISVAIVGTGQDRTVMWTSGDPLSLTGVDADSMLESGGETAEFNPSNSAGWKFTLPAAGVAPTAAPRCTP